MVPHGSCSGYLNFTRFLACLDNGRSLLNGSELEGKGLCACVFRLGIHVLFYDNVTWV